MKGAAYGSGGGAASTPRHNVANLSEFEYLFPASNRPPSPGKTGVLPALELNETEKRVYDSLRNEEMATDKVVRASGLPSSAVSVALFSLEMKWFVRR